jgi:pimeloyl-ACP methyl ester carboxylesterase
MRARINRLFTRHANDGAIARSLRVICIVGLQVLAARPATAGAPCAELTTFALAGHRVTIRQANAVAASAPGVSPAVPAHCRVDGVIDERTGRDGKPYAIGFAVALPAEWNGRFLFQGGGGLNGSVQPPLGAGYAGEKSALMRGFAVASTDSGHQGQGFDGAFFRDQLATLNFLYQGVAQVTVVGKAIVHHHYGKPPARAYFVGCSTGGREAMMMSQRFPDYYDGIVAVAPAARTSFSNLGLKYAAAALNAIAPRDAQGKPQTRLALSDADRKLVVDGVLQSCDALDGSRDGLIFAPHKCAFDPGTLACKTNKQEGCLSDAKVRAIRAIMQGPRTAAGRQVYPGYYYDTGIANTQGLAGILAGPFIPESAPVGTTFDVDAAAAEAMDARAMVGDSSAWTNLSSFRGRGGKLIFAHGVSDPWFSAQETVRYYELLGRDNAEEPLPGWSRLFLVPGMGHCGGGARTFDRFDLLSSLVSWVETGAAPEHVIATSAAAPGESRPLCPFPAHAYYAGTGDDRVAASYTCRN